MLSNSYKLYLRRLPLAWTWTPLSSRLTQTASILLIRLPPASNLKSINCWLSLLMRDNSSGGPLLKAWRMANFWKSRSGLFVSSKSRLLPTSSAHSLLRTVRRCRSHATQSKPVFSTTKSSACSSGASPCSMRRSPKSKRK